MHELNPLFEKYIDECIYTKRLRPETVRGYKEVYKTFNTIVPEVRLIQDLSTEVITTFFKRLEVRVRQVGKTQHKTGIKSSTIKTYGSKLNSFFDWLVRGGYMINNPVRSIRLPNPLYEDHRALRGAEVQKILASIITHSKTPFIMCRDLAMVYMFIFCGLRKNELLGLKVSDIDIHGKFITVRAETSKSKRSRRLFIHATLCLHLSQYLKARKDSKKQHQNLWVSNSSDEPLTSHGLKHWVSRLIRQSGVKFHVHRFRHTFATNLGRSGASILKIQKLMGHSQISMTMEYLRSIQPEDLSEDITRLSIENLA